MPGIRDDWTLAEADAALPEVRRLLAEARILAATLRDLEAQLQDLRIVWGDQVLAVACPGHAEFVQYRELHREAREGLELHGLRFAELGCEVKDVEQGLVDFRGRLADRPVYLCWREGEPAVAWWHPLETGFSGRRPIPGG